MTPSTPQRQQGNSDATFSSPPVKRPPSPEDSDADENDLLRHSLWGWKSKIDTTPSKRRALSDRDPNSKWTDEGRGWSPIPTTPPPKEADPVDLFSNLPTEILGKIAAYILPDSLNTLRLVARRFYQVCAAENSLWREAYFQQPGWGMRPLVSADWCQAYFERLELEERWNSGVPTSSYMLSGHDDSVYCSTIVRDKLITGGRDRKIKFWNIGYDQSQSTEPYMKLERAHERSVLCIKIDLNEHLMVTGSSDATVGVWEVEESLQYPPVKVVSLEGHDEGVLDVVLDSRYMISCSKDCSIMIWCRRTFAPLRHIPTAGIPVNCLDLWSSKACVIAALGDGTIWKFGLKNDDVNEHIREPADNLAAILRDGDDLYFGGIKCDLRQMDLNTGRPMLGLRGHQGLIRSIAGNPQLGRLVTASYDHTVRIWDLRRGCEIPTPVCFPDPDPFPYPDPFRHRHMVFSVSVDATTLVSTSYDHKIHVHKFGDHLVYAPFFV